MNADNKNLSDRSEDIDLLLLVERSILFFRKYRWAFIIAFVAGVLLGLFGYFSSPKIYKSRLVAHSFILTNQEQIQIIDTWNDLLKKNEYVVVAEAFNIPVDIVRKLKKIAGTEIQKVFSPVNPNGFYIDVIVTDNSILNELQKGIVYGLENGEYIKERLSYKKARLREMIDKLRLEILMLDSTKKQVENIIGGKEKPSSSVIIDGSSINRQLIDMNEKYLFFQEELNFTNGIQVLQGFSKYTKPSGRRLIVFIILGLMVTFSIAFTYTVLASVKERLKARSLLPKNP